MKTIKRVLLSIILLQAVCQPVNAIDLEAARKTAYSMGMEIKDRFLSQATEITNAITSHPKIFGAACLSFIGLAAIANYAYAVGSAQSYNQILERQQELLAKYNQARTEFKNFIETSCETHIDELEVQKFSFYKYLNKDAAYTLGIFIATYNNQPNIYNLNPILNLINGFEYYC